MSDDPHLQLANNNDNNNNDKKEEDDHDFDFCSFDYCEDFGTPRMDDYLTQTTVLAGGKSIPMCDLTERRMEVMSNDEYDKLEQK